MEYSAKLPLCTFYLTRHLGVENEITKSNGVAFIANWDPMSESMSRTLSIHPILLAISCAQTQPIGILDSCKRMPRTESNSVFHLCWDNASLVVGVTLWSILT